MTLQKRWNIPADSEQAPDLSPNLSPDLSKEISKELGVSPIIAALLVRRGMRDVKSASAFLSPDIKDLHDPTTLRGMARATERLATAVMDGERIALYGDYDVDGTTSVALMTLFFNALGVEPLCRIPDRISEGYGLNIAAVESLAEQGVAVIITADCGSTNHEEVARGASLGIDVIITDHHELPDGPPPDAYATINPKQQGCDFPFKGLSGVGVAFNLVIALRARLRDLGYFTGGAHTEPNLSQYLDLVAVGTVADMVPLVDENRILVHLGLKVLSKAKRPGLKALMESAGVEPAAVDSGAIGFKIGPRINAAGRVASATIAYRLLVTDDAREAKVLAERLETENTIRRELEARILDEAIEEVERTEANKNRAMALSSDRWHPGVIGIVASRLVERYSRPVVMIAVEGGVGKGSVRSVKSVDVVNALGVCAELLTRFGGHRAAAGLTIESGRIEEFKSAFVSHFNSTLTDDDLVGELNLDAGVELSTIDIGFATELRRLAPFGMGNKEPLLYIEGLKIERTEILKSKHLRLQLSQNGYERKAIAFNMAALHPLEGDGYTIAFSTGLNEWRGRVSADIKIKGVRRAD